MRWISCILGVLLVCSACGKVEVLGKGSDVGYVDSKGIDTGDTKVNVTYVLKVVNTLSVDVRDVIVKVNDHISMKGMMHPVLNMGAVDIDSMLDGATQVKHQEIRVDKIDNQVLTYVVRGYAYTDFVYEFELWSGDVYLGKAVGSLPYRVIEDGDVYTFDINPDNKYVDFILPHGLSEIGFNAEVDAWGDKSADIRG